MPAVTRAIGIALFLTGILGFQAVAAETIDGSRPFLCALRDIVACADDDCQEETPESANAPQFLRVDVATKVIQGTRPDGEERTAPITTVERREQRLLLQGIDDGPLSWSIAIVEATGRMMLTGSKENIGFIVTGACTTP